MSESNYSENRYYLQTRKINTYSMNIYVLLHFEDKNDVTIILKVLHTATSRNMLVQLLNSFVLHTVCFVDIVGSIDRESSQQLLNVVF